MSALRRWLIGATAVVCALIAAAQLLSMIWTIACAEAASKSTFLLDLPSDQPTCAFLGNGSLLIPQWRPDAGI